MPQRQCSGRTVAAGLVLLVAVTLLALAGNQNAGGGASSTPQPALSGSSVLTGDVATRINRGRRPPSAPRCPDAATPTVTRPAKSAPLGASLDSSGAAPMVARPAKSAPLGASLDSSGAAIRRFYVPSCGESYTIPELYPDFAAHQVEWNIMGKTSAFWSVNVAMPKHDAEVSAGQKDGFYKSGVEHAEELIPGYVRRIQPEFKPRGRVLDFGCGLGRITHGLRLLPDVTSVTCVEQSVHHVDKTRIEMPHLAPGVQAAPTHLVVSTPDLVSSLRQDADVPVCYEYVQTLIVMQHMIRPLQAVYLEQFCDVLAAGGVMAVQIPYMTPYEAGCTEVERAEMRKTGGMQMHWMARSDAQQILTARGCKVDILDIGADFVAEEASEKWGSMVIVARKLPDELLPPSVIPCRL